MFAYRGPSNRLGTETAETWGHPWQTSVEEIGRQYKNYTSGALRAGVFGVNDGLVSNKCLVMGVAGAGVGPSEILLTGVAGLLAGAFSMGAGVFISMLSQREMFEHQIAQERDELQRYPDQEAEEIAIIYEARGIPPTEARDMAKRLIANPEKALDVLTREELGLNPEELGSPISAAISSFLTFCVGTCVPLIPFLLGREGWDLDRSDPRRHCATRGWVCAQPDLRQECAPWWSAYACGRLICGGSHVLHRNVFWGDYRVMHSARCVEPAGRLLQSGTRPGPRIGGSRT